MHILVSGSHGYLGSVLVPRLLAAGHSVIALDNMFFGQSTLAEHCANPRFEPHKVDCRDVSAVRPFLKDADIIIPLACLVGAPICNINPIDAELLNSKAHIDLFKLLSPDQLVIFPSTESVYGKNAELCTEETPTNPLVSYGVQKLEVEKALMDREHSVIFRMATLFGMSPRMRLDLLINDFVWRALKDRAMVVFEGHAMRTCLHVTDAARAFEHVIDSDEYLLPDVIYMPDGIYNVGSITLSKLSLCAEIKKQVPGFFYVEAQYATDPDARDYVVSDAKIRATGFEPMVGLGEGISELLKGFRMMKNTLHGNV